MKSIEIKAKRFFFFNCTYKGVIPETWEEVNAQQLLAIAQMYNHENTQLNVIAQFTGLPLSMIRKLTNIELYHVLQEFDFIKDFRPRNCFIIPGVNKFVAPRHKLDALLWGQFIFIESYFEQYSEKPTDEALNLFFAHLYLPKYQTFDHDSASTMAKHKQITSIPKNTKLAVIINYRLIREWLTITYPIVFSKREESTTTTPSKSQQNPWLLIYNAIVGDDLIHYNDYSKLEFHVVMRYLTEKIKENARKKH